MQSYGQRVRFARERIQWSQAKLAREIGLQQPSLHAIEVGPAKRSKHTLAIAEKTGVRAEWLEKGIEPIANDQGETFVKPPPRAASPDFDFQKMDRDLPVLGAAAAGNDGLFALNGQTVDFARRPPRLVGVVGAYAIYIAGDSMSPWRENGDIACINPHQPAKIMDYVVVQLRQEKDGDDIRAYVKRLVRRTAKEVTLLQYNPRKEIVIPAKDIGAIHRILDWSELLTI